MIYIKVILCCMLSVALQTVSAQQTYQKKGNNFHAAVTIQRDMQPPTSYARSQESQPSRFKPWRQGDRLTKQELIQNIAKALLTRKKTPSERKEEERKQNELHLQEYLMIQAGLAGKSPVPPNTASMYQQSPQPQFGGGALPGQNPNAYNNEAASPQRPGQASVTIERQTQNERNYQGAKGNGRFTSQTGNTFRGNQPDEMNGQQRRTGQQQKGPTRTSGYNSNARANQRASQQSQPQTRVYMPR